MSANQIIFYLISAFMLGTGMLAVTSRKIFRSAIWLLSTLIGVAGLYFWMDMQFIAAVQIVIYVGGIVVLIIFSIFLTQQSGKEMPKPPLMRVIAGALAALFGFGFSFQLISHYPFPVSNQSSGYDINSIGSKMLGTGEDGFALPFEVVSILLLAAMVGCIVIAMRAKPISNLKSDVSGSDSQNGQRQMSADSETTSNLKSQTSN